LSSAIVRVDTRRGPVCVKRALPQLKVAAQWLAPVERNRAEVAWIRLAAQVAPGSVPGILAEDAESKSFAMEYLDPATYPVWKAQLRDGRIEAATAVAVATHLVRIHAATANDADVAQRFANDASFHALRLDPYFGAAAQVHADCAPVLQHVIETTASTKLALVHGDVSPKNILVGPNGPVLLDAECAWFGDPAFDLAFVLNHLLLKCVWRPASTGALLACFDALATRYLAGVIWEPAATIEARTSRLLAAMLLARIDGKSPVEYITDATARARVRRFARHFLLQPADRLDALRAAWASERQP
jgi:5-methylthioribose kinase